MQKIQIPTGVQVFETRASSLIGDHHHRTPFFIWNSDRAWKKKLEKLFESLESGDWKCPKNGPTFRKIFGTKNVFVRNFFNFMVGLKIFKDCPTFFRFSFDTYHFWIELLRIHEIVKFLGPLFDFWNQMLFSRILTYGSQKWYQSKENWKKVGKTFIIFGPTPLLL